MRLISAVSADEPDMSARRTLATTRRILLQLRHDPRTVALMLIVPCMLMTLLRYVYDDQPKVFDRIGPMLLALFPFTVMFLITSVAMLRERSTGTLERLLATPTAKLDILAGYALAFGAATDRAGRARDRAGARAARVAHPRQRHDRRAVRLRRRAHGDGARTCS